MLGPLPPLYRLTIALLAVGLLAALGAWLGHLTTVPFLPHTGALAGGAAGVLIAGLLTHEPRRRDAVRRR